MVGGGVVVGFAAAPGVIGGVGGGGGGGDGNGSVAVDVAVVAVAAVVVAVAVALLLLLLLCCWSAFFPSSSSRRLSCTPPPHLWSAFTSSPPRTHLFRRYRRRTGEAEGLSQRPSR